LIADGVTALPITDERMTRFWLNLEDGVEFVLKNFQRMQGGEIFIPKIPSMRILDLAKAIAPNLPIKVIGIRPGEKLHEIMCPADIYYETLEFENHFVIMPSTRLVEDYTVNAIGEKGCPVSDGFEYNSGTNPHFLTVEELREMNP
jgi:UDP-N-acetylglucosamine 4,6-dehydratase